MASMGVGSDVQGYVYVANADSATVTVIDTSDAVIDTLSVGTAPVSVAVNPLNGNVYVSNYVSSTV